MSAEEYALDEDFYVFDIGISPNWALVARFTPKL
jgi:hypothetical protein